MPAFTGSLNTNEIQSAIYNMIIAQYVHTKNIAGGYDNLLNLARQDGGLYGDQVLHYATDAYQTYEYDPDTENQCNVLAVHRPPAPKCQSIVLNNARYIPITIDDYFSKRAFSTEATFADYNGAVINWLQDTKEIYLQTTFNSYVGTAETAVGKQQATVTLTGITAATTTSDEESKNRIQAQYIGKKIADIIVELKDAIHGKDYNDYGFYRSFNEDDLVIVWNADWFNKIRKVDLTTIFHDAGVIDKLDAKYVLPASYFGTINTADGKTTASNTTVRALKETVYGNKHVFAGELLPNTTNYTANTTYTVNDNIICKIMSKQSIPVLTGVEGEKVFINGKNWSENRYLHFLVNTFEYLKDMPMITVKAVTA